MNHSDPLYSRAQNLILHANRLHNWIFNEHNEQWHLQRCHFKILYSQCNSIRLIGKKRVGIRYNMHKVQTNGGCFILLSRSNMSQRASVIYNNIISHSIILANCSIHKYTDSSSSSHREKHSHPIIIMHYDRLHCFNLFSRATKTNDPRISSFILTGVSDTGKTTHTILLHNTVR